MVARAPPVQLRRSTMAQFTVRIELHSATSEQYTTLHTLMEASGFRRVIRGVDASGSQGWWQLPIGEYDGDFNETAVQVRDRAKLISDAVKTGAWVLVTQVADRSWTTQKIQG